MLARRWPEWTITGSKPWTSYCPAEPSAILHLIQVNSSGQVQSSRELGSICGLVSPTQWAGAQHIGEKEIEVRHSHKRRQGRIVRSTKVSRQRTHGRMGTQMGIGLAPLRQWVARLHGRREVIHAGPAIDGTNDGQAIHDARLARELVTNADAGGLARD